MVGVWWGGLGNSSWSSIDASRRPDLLIQRVHITHPIPSSWSTPDLFLPLQAFHSPPSFLSTSFHRLHQGDVDIRALRGHGLDVDDGL